MENFFPVLIAIAVFLFQAFANYRKEQEKARRRKTTVPPLPEKKAVGRSIRSRQAPGGRPQPITSQPSSVGPSVPAAIQSANVGYSSGLERAELDEVKRVRLSRLQRQEHQRLEVTDVGESVDSHKVRFNLREAIIQSAILNRPYD